LIASLILLWHELAHLHYADIRAAINRIATAKVALAVLFTVANYLVLIGYDYLAVKSIGRPIPLKSVALASFVGFATSYNFSTLFGGPAIRYRFYGKWGFSTNELIRILGMIGITFWIGACALAGVLFTVLNEKIPESLRLPIASTRPIGIVLFVFVIGYLVVLARSGDTLRLWRFYFPLPSLKLTLGQIVVAVVDIAIAAAAMYVLVGDEMRMGYVEFLSTFLLATLTVVVTNVPGGIGVFELVIISHAPEAASSPLVASLLVFRAIYYLIPLAISMVLLTMSELAPYRPQIRASIDRGTNWWRIAAPFTFSIATFFAGSILVLSGATPGIAERIHFASRFIPTPLLELSHVLASVVGACLLLLARGLYRRLDSAYWVTCVLLTAGAAFSLIKGFDYEEALFLGVVLLGLLPARNAFYRQGKLIHQHFGSTWIPAIIAVVACAVWLGLFGLKSHRPEQPEWWSVVLSDEAPRGVRATVASAGVLVVYSVMRLLSPFPPRPKTASPEQLRLANHIVDHSKRSYAHLALIGDKELIFNESNDAFVMYARQGRSWVAMGDPVGPDEAVHDLVWKYRELVDRYGGWPVFYQVDPRHVTVYLDQGLTLLKIGEEARVSLKEFGLQGSDRRGLRQTVNKMHRDGIEFSMLSAEELPNVLGELKEISNDWLEHKLAEEKGFSLGYFDEDYLSRYPCAVARHEGKIIAFANVWTNSAKVELSIDLMRFSSEAPNGVMEFLFIELMLWGKQEGYAYFSLGMAPLSGIESRKLSPVWNRVTNFLFRHGDRFYRFEGLRQYKDKFDPVWSSRYIALPGGVALPRILADVTRLIGKRRDEESD
jgi:phosphatidylglycerol lysyltransferase